MKAKELREMTEDEIKKVLEDNREEAFNLRFQKVAQEIENPMRLRVVRRNIARIKTVMNERKIK